MLGMAVAPCIAKWCPALAKLCIKSLRTPRQSYVIELMVTEMTTGLQLATGVSLRAVRGVAFKVVDMAIRFLVLALADMISCYQKGLSQAWEDKTDVARHTEGGTRQLMKDPSTREEVHTTAVNCMWPSSRSLWY